MNDDSLETKLKEMDVRQIKNAVLDFLVPIVCLAVSVLLFFLYVRPTLENIRKVETEIVTNEGLLKNLKEKSLALNKMKNYNSVLQENSALVEKLLSSESNVPQLLDEIHQISTNSGMEVERLSYSYSGIATSDNADAQAGIREKDVSGNVNVSLSVDGNYDQLALLLSEVERAARVAFVNTFRFGSSTTEETTGNITANITVDSPYMYVQSVAVTDDKLELDITSQQFVDFINKIKSYRVYEFLNPDIVSNKAITVEESAETEEKTEETSAEETTPFGGALE